MTPEQKKNIKLGASYLRPISAEDIRRRDQWIENQLPQVLDLALAQASELTKMQSEIDEFSYKLRETYVEIDELKAELERLRKLPDLVGLVSEWGRQKGITGEGGKGTLKGQVAKMVEEANEVSEEIEILQSVDSLTAVSLEIGDVIVTAILLCDLLKISVNDCLDAAYQKISKRVGKMEGGVFVRDKDGGKSEPSTLGMP